MTTKLQIITPQKVAYEDDVDMIVVPALDGEIGILPRHAPLAGRLNYGELRIKKGNKTEYFFIEEGFLKATQKNVLILTSNALSSDEFNQKELEKQQKELTSKTDKKMPAAEKITLQKMNIKLKILSKVK